MHTLNLSATDKAERYREILPQIGSVIEGERNLTANLANTAAILKEAFGWLWIGFYLVDAADNTLVLGPFQGPLACTRIPYGRGVCGQAWASGQTIVVDDVNTHPDHIACSSLSQSEIVVPLLTADGRCIGVLDADAAQTAQFDATDARYLEELAALLRPYFE
ncbi:GAF domain-containing protein [Bergeriella denitrificans]|uniref:GAF-domain containing protein n=1 Tax=Bergeriella denitrificans TaxID=494 RepID=A0A378UDF6_BERDE|nr:GAF domain-containing protein [Bergeriella denitrificans]STZ75337.1 GAF-domain containing protein [Bergeriella denitrificans]